MTSPPHYTFSRFEVIDVLEAWFPQDPLLWQVGKYISRAGRKGPMLEDLQKARWFLDRRIERVEAEARSAMERMASENRPQVEAQIMRAESDE